MHLYAHPPAAFIGSLPVRRQVHRATPARWLGGQVRCLTTDHATTTHTHNHTATRQVYAIGVRRRSSYLVSIRVYLVPAVSSTPAVSYVYVPFLCACNMPTCQRATVVRRLPNCIMRACLWSSVRTIRSRVGEVQPAARQRHQRHGSSSKSRSGTPLVPSSPLALALPLRLSTLCLLRMKERKREKVDNGTRSRIEPLQTGGYPLPRSQELAGTAGAVGIIWSLQSQLEDSRLVNGGCARASEPLLSVEAAVEALVTYWFTAFRMWGGKSAAEDATIHP